MEACDPHQNTEAVKIPLKRKSYTAEFKLHAVKYAAENGNRAAERMFGVSEKLVRDWRKAEDTLAAMKKTKRANRGLKARWPELEERVRSWVLEQSAAGVYLSTEQLRLYAQMVAKEMNIEDFAGGPSWCYRFLQRNLQCIRDRERTSMYQILPAEFQCQVDSFLEHLPFESLRTIMDQMFRGLVNERLNAAAGEISVLIERRMAEYEEVLSRYREEAMRRQEFLVSALNVKVMVQKLRPGHETLPVSVLESMPLYTCVKTENPSVLEQTEHQTQKEENTSDAETMTGLFPEHGDDWQRPICSPPEAVKTEENHCSQRRPRGRPRGSGTKRKLEPQEHL